MKPAVTKALNELLAPIQAAYKASKEWQDIALKAYPAPAPPKKEKKVKDKGSRYPGGARPNPAAPAETPEADVKKLKLEEKN